MEISGLKKATIQEYNYTFNRFINDLNLTYVSEITQKSIYEWLSKLENANAVSKSNKLKVISAVLNRFFGWVQTKFWKAIKIKTDKKVKKAASKNHLLILLSLLDTSTFIGFRDSVAILLLYKTGIRINTLGLLEENVLD